MEQSDLKRLVRKIDELTKKPTETYDKVHSDSGVKLVSQIAKFALANKAYRFQISSFIP